MVSGSTSEPNARVVVTIGDQIIGTVSDANGKWMIEVEAGQLDRGVPLRIGLQAYTRDIVSELVQVAQIILPTNGEDGLTTEEEIPAVLELLPAPVAQALVATQKAVTEVARQVSEVAREVEPESQATLTVLAPVVTLVNPTIALNLPNLPMFMFHFMSWLGTVLGIKRKRKPWGTAYDAISKEPLSLAIVRLYQIEGGHDSKSAGLPGPGAADVTTFDSLAIKATLLETQVTDAQGRFGFLPRLGKYKLEVTKTGYKYPSAIVSGSTDADFENVYRSEEFEIKDLAQGISNSIPLDPVNPTAEKTEARQKGLFAGMVYAVRRFIGRTATIFIVVGLVVSLVTTLSSPTITNLVIFGLYSLFALFQRVLEPKAVKPWGVVYETGSLKPVPLAVVNILDTQYNKLLKTRLTDYEGRFSFLPPVGKYKLLIQKAGYKFPSAKKDVKAKQYGNNYFGGDFQVSKDKQVIDIDVPVDAA